MPHPKRRHSTTRRDKRRTHDKLETKPFIVDEVSGTPALYHRVNLESGYYRGRQVMKGKDE
ncbi:MAG: 50S ribosomal protein L32 [Bacteroidia bacterium]|nr:50S ribosomal protein L32 [Bacteroidia bacterium]